MDSRSSSPNTPPARIPIRQMEIAVFRDFSRRVAVCEAFSLDSTATCMVRRFKSGFLSILLLSAGTALDCFLPHLGNSLKAPAFAIERDRAYPLEQPSEQPCVEQRRGH